MIKIYERNRAKPIGEWTDVAFTAGDFTSVGGGSSWTLQSGDVTTFAYAQVGKTVSLSLQLSTTTIAGTPSQLLVLLPGSMVSARDMETQAFYADTNTGERIPCRMFVGAGGTHVQFFRNDGGNWANSTNTAYFFGTLTFSIQ